MTEEQNTIALNKARTFSDNKDKIDGFYNGYVQATKELQERISKAEELLTKAIKNTWSIDWFVVDEIHKFLNSEVEK